MIVSESKIKRIIREILLKEQFSAGDIESAGGGRSGGGPDPTKERCCVSWTNRTDKWRKAREATKKAERDPESDRLRIKFLRDKEKDLLDKIPKKFAPHGPSGDWLVDKCGNNRGEPVYKTVNGIKVFAYSCTHSPGGRDIGQILGDTIIKTFTPGTDLNRIANLIDITRVTQLPNFVDAGKALSDDPSSANAGLFVLATLDVIPGASMAKNFTEEASGEIVSMLADEYKDELNNAGFSDEQIDHAISTMEHRIGKTIS